MHIRVMKADRSTEPYLHTKVLGTVHHALSQGGQGDLYTAEQLSEAITFYLYRQPQSRQLNTEEIHLMIMAVLRDTGYDRAAEILSQHRLERKLQRKRIEILCGQEDSATAIAWDKSMIADELMTAFRMERALARVIAGSVEEKIMKMGLTHINRSLLNELIEADREAMQRAEQSLQIH